MSLVHRLPWIRSQSCNSCMTSDKTKHRGFEHSAPDDYFSPYSMAFLNNYNNPSNSPNSGSLWSRYPHDTVHWHNRMSTDSNCISLCWHTISHSRYTWVRISCWWVSSLTTPCCKTCLSTKGPHLHGNNNFRRDNLIILGVFPRSRISNTSVPQMVIISAQWRPAKGSAGQVPKHA